MKFVYLLFLFTFHTIISGLTSWNPSLRNWDNFFLERHLIVQFLHCFVNFFLMKAKDKQKWWVFNTFLISIIQIQVVLVVAAFFRIFTLMKKIAHFSVKVLITQEKTPRTTEKRFIYLVLRVLSFYKHSCAPWMVPLPNDVIVLLPCIFHKMQPS